MKMKGERIERCDGTVPLHINCENIHNEFNIKKLFVTDNSV